MSSIIWITGASSGIGKSIAKKFREAGFTVAISSRNEDELNKYVTKGKGGIIPAPLDLTNFNSIKKAYELLSEKFEIDCLINNAGITSFKQVLETSVEETGKIIKTNLLGAIFTTELVLPEMIKRKRGTIINNLSVATEKVFKNSAVYSASKAGLKMFSKVLREETREHNVRIINIYPGATRTPMWNNDSLNEFGNRMMSADDVAEIFLQAYLNKSTAVSEEIVLRPPLGDI